MAGKWFTLLFDSLLALHPTSDTGRHRMKLYVKGKMRSAKNERDCPNLELNLSSNEAVFHYLHDSVDLYHVIKG